MKRLLAIAVLTSGLCALAASTSLAGEATSDDPLTQIIATIDTIVMLPIKVIEDLSK